MYISGPSPHSSGQYFIDTGPEEGLREIKCHKLILARNSDVFERMFEHDCVENQRNELTIVDFDGDTVADFVIGDP